MFAKTLGRKITVGTALLIASIGTAQAVPAYWDDWAYDPGTLINSSNPYSYSHDITDWGSGDYRPGIDSITSGSLSIWLYDDAFFGDLPFLGDANETVGFRFDGGSWTASEEVDGNIFIWDDFDFIVTSLISDGMLNVNIRANRGDFRFGSSHLEAWGNRGDGVAVPEPATLSLFGLGLLGLGFAARRRKA
jgi:hypothetical protein